MFVYVCMFIYLAIYLDIYNPFIFFVITISLLMNLTMVPQYCFVAGSTPVCDLEYVADVTVHVVTRKYFFKILKKCLLGTAWTVISRLLYLTAH